jgi:hypothetical protein
MVTLVEIAETAVVEYMKQRQNGLLPDQARTVMLDTVKEMALHVVVIEEPSCCDAVPRVEWLHHQTCPEVQAHHAEHEEAHPDCPTCAVQRRKEDHIDFGAEAESGSVQ